MPKSPRDLVFRHDLRTKAIHTHEEDDMMRNISTKNLYIGLFKTLLIRHCYGYAFNNLNRTGELM